MSKTAFDQISAGMHDAIAYANGNTAGAETHIPATVDLKAIRKRLRLNQPDFAHPSVLRWAAFATGSSTAPQSIPLLASS